MENKICCTFCGSFTVLLYIRLLIRKRSFLSQSSAPEFCTKIVQRYMALFVCLGSPNRFLVTADKQTVAPVLTISRDHWVRDVQTSFKMAGCSRRELSVEPHFCRDCHCAIAFGNFYSSTSSSALLTVASRQLVRSEV